MGNRATINKHILWLGLTITFIFEVPLAIITYIIKVPAVSFNIIWELLDKPLDSVFIL